MNKTKKVLQVSFLVVSAFIIGAFVHTTFAGSLTPVASPASTMYRLEDIYNKLIDNTTSATEGAQSFTTPGSVSATFHTLKEIFENIPDLDASKILSGTTYMGVDGTASAGADLSNMYNGTCLSAISGNCPNGDEFPGGSQSQGGVEDGNFNTHYVGQAPPPDRYASTWTICNIGNDYCGTSDTGANAKDEATGLVWSYPCAGSGCATWDTSVPDVSGCQNNGSCDYYNTDTYYSWDNSRVDNNSRTAQQLCSDHAGCLSSNSNCITV
jgi:hypothetical protein